jgi:hypothetical protein
MVADTQAPGASVSIVARPTAQIAGYLLVQPNLLEARVAMMLWQALRSASSSDSK